MYKSGTEIFNIRDRKIIDPLNNYLSGVFMGRETHYGRQSLVVELFHDAFNVATYSERNIHHFFAPAIGNKPKTLFREGDMNILPHPSNFQLLFFY